MRFEHVLGNDTRNDRTLCGEAAVTRRRWPRWPSLDLVNAPTSITTSAIYVSSGVCDMKYSRA